MKQSNFFNDKLTRAPDGASPGAQPEPAPAAAPAPAAVTPPAADPGPDLSFIPADFHVDGKPDLAKFTAHYQDIVADNARRAERDAGVPEDGVYDFAVPTDLKFDGLDLPPDYAYTLAKDDPAMQPLFAELGTTLKDLGIPKDSAGKLIGILAKYEATRVSQAYATNKAEMAALGTPAQQQARMGAIERIIDSRLPADLAEAMKGSITSAKAVRAIEALLQPRTPVAPTPTPPGAGSENLSAYDRLKLANAQARA